MLTPHVFSVTTLHYLRVGHTHEDVDHIFGQLATPSTLS